MVHIATSGESEVRFLFFLPSSWVARVWLVGGRNKVGIRDLEENKNFICFSSSLSTRCSRLEKRKSHDDGDHDLQIKTRSKEGTQGTKSGAVVPEASAKFAWCLSTFFRPHLQFDARGFFVVGLVPGRSLKVDSGWKKPWSHRRLGEFKEVLRLHYLYQFGASQHFPAIWDEPDSLTTTSFTPWHIHGKIYEPNRRFTSPSGNLDPTSTSLLHPYVPSVLL